VHKDLSNGNMMGKETKKRVGAVSYNPLKGLDLQRCEREDYVVDEENNELGPNRCIINCDCEGERFCNSKGLCESMDSS